MRDFRLGRGGSGTAAAPDFGPPNAVLRFGAHRRTRKKTCAARAALLAACAKPARGDCVSYWFRNDSRMPQMRLKVVSFGIVAIITLLLSGFWKLQVVDSDHYTQLAERNSIRTIPSIAPIFPCWKCCWYTGAAICGADLCPTCPGMSVKSASSRWKTVMGGCGRVISSAKQASNDNTTTS